MKKYRLVWFQHLHKAAGTYVIRRAIANGEKLFPINENGNPCDDNGVIPLWDMTGRDLSKFVDTCEEMDVTFVATEWGGPDFHILSKDPRVCLITCIRDPINRFISNFNFDYYWMWSKSTNYEQYLMDKRSTLHQITTRGYSPEITTHQTQLRKATFRLPRKTSSSLTRS